MRIGECVKENEAFVLGKLGRKKVLRLHLRIWLAAASELSQPYGSGELRSTNQITLKNIRVLFLHRGGRGNFGTVSRRTL